MLKSIGYWFLRRGLKYLAPVLNFLWNKELKNYSQNRDPFQPVFIVGPPRSGSTILYQLITNYLYILYVDNLMNMTREATWFGGWLSNKVYGSTPHNSFESHHGRTLKNGLHAPNEGLFWYKWLPKETHYVGAGQIPKESIAEMQDIVFGMMNRYKKPFVFKNLSFSMRLAFIKEAFPNAKIIYIKRDPVYIAQSIYLAKKKEGILEGEVWSIRPRNEEFLLKMTKTEHVVKQAYMIEQQIHNDLKLFVSDQVTVIDYEKIYDSEKLLEKLAGFIFCQRRSNDNMPKIRISNEQKVDDSVFEKIVDEVNKLDWESFSTKI